MSSVVIKEKKTIRMKQFYNHPLHRNLLEKHYIMFLSSNKSGLSFVLACVKFYFFLNYKVSEPPGSGFMLTLKIPLVF